MGSGARAARLLIVVVVVASGAVEGVARACAACGCGDPTLTSSGLEKPYRNRVRLSLEERFGGHGSGVYPGSELAWTLRSSLMASWSPIDRLTLMGVLPLQTEWLASDTRPTRHFTGLGDAELSLRGVVWRNRGFSPSQLVSLIGGIKLPTGPRLLDDQGYPWPEDDQPGSGSWDPFAGAAWVWFGDTLSAYASMSWRQTTVGRRGYQHGSSLGASAGAQLQPVGRFAFGLALDLRYALADTMASVDDRGGPQRVDASNTGGASVAVTPSVLVSILDPWLVRAAVQVHMWDHWNGHQSESWTFLLSTVVDLN